MSKIMKEMIDIEKKEIALKMVKDRKLPCILFQCEK